MSSGKEWWKGEERKGGEKEREYTIDKKVIR